MRRRITPIPRDVLRFVYYGNNDTAGGGADTNMVTLMVIY
jgi:hypothetical protein